METRTIERARTRDEAREHFPEAVEILEGERTGVRFIESVAWKFGRYGTLTRKQAEAVVDAYGRHQKRLNDRAAKEELGIEVEAGQGVTVRGELVAVYEKRGPKMILVAENGTRIFGYRSTPALKQAERGDKVRFVADVTQSPDDRTFGFAKKIRDVVNETATYRGVKF